MQGESPSANSRTLYSPTSIASGSILGKSANAPASQYGVLAYAATLRACTRFRCPPTDPPITSIAIARAYTPTRLSTYSRTPACTAVPAFIGIVPNVKRLPRSPNTTPPIVAATGPMAAMGTR